MTVYHCKRVDSFPHLLKRLLTETRIWDNVHVSTNIEAVMPQTFQDGETEWFLYVNVYYTDEDGIDDMSSFIYQTHKWDWLMEMEEKVRQLIIPIFE